MRYLERGAAGRFSHHDTPLLINKLQQRQSLGKSLDMIVADVDGTVYVREPGIIYIGENKKTRKQMQKKRIPLILNTGRPFWDETQDTEISKIELSPPDAVIAGTGTIIYWRGANGNLHVDQEYANKMRKHPVKLRYGKTEVEATFVPEPVLHAIAPVLFEYGADTHITDVILDQGPLLSDNSYGVDGLRLAVNGLSYEAAHAIRKALPTVASGIKLHMSEVTRYSNDEQFSGWLHVIPSIAGKDRATRYVLEKTVTTISEPISAYAFGDASIDLPLLTMGTNFEEDRYVVHQYGVQNVAPYTRKKLLRVVESLSSERGMALHRRAHLSIHEQKGPDAIYDVVNSLQ